jgi:hypothetical protein
MKKSQKPILLVFVFLIVLLTGCTSVPAPIATATPVPPTLTPKPIATKTATPIPTPTDVPLIWKPSPLIDKAYNHMGSEAGFYSWDEMPESGVVFDTDTRWNIDIQVNNRRKDVGEASTGIVLVGYTESGETPRLVLVYQYGKWSLGYRTHTDFTYWQTFESLTAPMQSFELSIPHDGRSFLLKNDQGFKFQRTMTDVLFSDVQFIMIGMQTGPYTELLVSKLVAEQLRNPSELVAEATSLKTPYTVSFEDLTVSNPSEIQPFRLSMMDIVSLFNSWDDREENYSSWSVDSRAHSGKIALNAIPNGNPITDSIVRPTVAVLGPLFDVSGYSTVSLEMWINTTSNPRVMSVHNCDSDLGIYYKTDSDPWVKKRVICGEHKTESQGWQEVIIDFDVVGKTTIQFAFDYTVQKVTKTDPSVYYLVDDLEITAK